MSHVTFGTKQELKSFEFGNLLYGIIQKGVYKSPKITLSTTTGTITVSDGIFLFYNDTESDESKAYAAKVENIDLSIEGASADEYLLISYTYDPSMKAEPVLSFSNNYDSGDSKIRLGRIIRKGSGTYNLDVDESCMELVGTGYSSENSFVDFLTYSHQETENQRLGISFNGKVITNSGIVTIAEINTTSFENLDPEKAQYLYIDHSGTVKLADSDVPRLGKLVFAEKPANGNFSINRYPYLAEINTGTIEALTIADNEICDEAIDSTKVEFNTSSNIATLDQLLKKMIKHINDLESSNADLIERVSYLEKVKGYVGGAMTIPSKEEFDEDPTLETDRLEIKNVDIATNANIKGSITVDSSTSSFGTASRPIKNLYVSESLYTDKLFVTE